MTRPSSLAELRRLLFLGALLASLCLFPGSVRGQTAADRITRPVEQNVRTRWSGSRHPLARPEFDAGRVRAEAPVQRIVLVLQPDAVQERDLERLLAAQQDPVSPQFHQWLTPEEFGRQFGLSDHDLNQIVRWLEDQGFAVEAVPAGRRQVVFSGTAGQIEKAFHTELHEYRVNGALHHANSTDLEIPSALAPALGGILSLNDFHSKPMHTGIQPAGTAPEYTSSSGVHYISPGDFAAIYNLGPLYGSSTNGKGQSIAIVARSNLNITDVEAFRASFGLITNDPTVIVNGSDPGVLANAELGEVQLDTEWAGAVAPNASIQVVVSGSTQGTDGVALSAQYIVNASLAPIVSVSFGNCESSLGRSGNQFWNALWQQAASQGMSVFVASGDSGAADCDDSPAATGTTADVNGLCSSPYATCVGGTQLNDTINPAQYWYSTNTNRVSAIGYIPEAAWNESGSAGGSALWASGGGASHTYSKPTWQTGRGVPADNHRDVPDVALASASHDGYLFYMNGSSYVGSGTSVAAPSFAGLMALIVSRQGTRQGNANPSLYTLAANQTRGGSAVFHDITSGNNSVPGVSGYSAGAGYDQVTGLGSVNANLLVNAWNNGSAPPPKCTYSLDSSGAAPDATAQNLSVMLTASASTCSWTASSDSDWLIITSRTSGTDSQMVAYSVLENPSSLPRTGTLTIAGLSFTVTQAGAICNFTVSASDLRSNSDGFHGSVSVSAPGGCGWTAATQVSWMIITSGATGSGNGIVTFTVASNTGAMRSGTLTVAGSTITVTEAPRSKLGLVPLPVPKTLSQ